MYGIALLSHVNGDEFNEMGLFDMKRFSDEKETYLSIIYTISHSCPDSIREDASLDGSDQGLSYGLDDTINNDSDFEDIEKQSHHLSLKSSMRMNEISHTG